VHCLGVRHHAASTTLGTGQLNIRQAAVQSISTPSSSVGCYSPLTKLLRTDCGRRTSSSARARERALVLRGAAQPPKRGASKNHLNWIADFSRTSSNAGRFYRWTTGGTRYRSYLWGHRLEPQCARSSGNRML
jgi:hypothetical protein